MSLSSSTTPCIDVISKTQGFGPCPAGLNEIEGMVANVIFVIVGLGFVAALILIIFTGIKYLTSGGEPKAVQAAHYTLTWAILGIFFLAIAWIILQLIGVLTGVNVTVFNFKSLCGDPNNIPDPAKWFCGQP